MRGLRNVRIVGGVGQKQSKRANPHITALYGMVPHKGGGQMTRLKPRAGPKGGVPTQLASIENKTAAGERRYTRADLCRGLAEKWDRKRRALWETCKQIRGSGWGGRGGGKRKRNDIDGQKKVKTTYRDKGERDFREDKGGGGYGGHGERIPW